MKIGFATDTNILRKNKLSEMMSANPAKLLGLNQGLIEEGLRADLVLIDENCENVIDTSNFISKGKNNPFNGQRVKGKVIMTIKNGKIMYDIKGDM